MLTTLRGAERVRRPNRRARGAPATPTRGPALSTTVLDPAAARTELARFLALADELDSGLPMFSEFVDAAWHDLVADAEGYARFCAGAGVPAVEHVSGMTEGPARIGWVADYERRWGALPVAWFADASGTVDTTAAAAYHRAGTVTASWDCTPRRVPTPRPTSPRPE